MAAQLAEKGHPALQTVSADAFGRALAEIHKETPPSDVMLKRIANGRKVLQTR